MSASESLIEFGPSRTHTTYFLWSRPKWRKEWSSVSTPSEKWVEQHFLEHVSKHPSHDFRLERSTKTTEEARV